MRKAAVIAICLAVFSACAPKAGRPAARAEKPQAASGFVDVAGARLTYFIEGEGIPCITATDGLLMSRALSKQLRKHFRFIFFNSRVNVQHEKSFKIDSITMDTLVDNIEQVRKALDLDKICVLGHSIAGLLALEYARKYPMHTTHVIMHGTPPNFSSDADDIKARYWRSHASPKRKAIYKQKWDDMPEDTLSILSPSDADILRYITDGPKIWYDPEYDPSWLFEGVFWNVEVWDQIFNVIMKEYDISQGSLINTPVFLALGRHDYYTVPPWWDDEKSKLPNLSYHLFEKSGHYPMLEEQVLFDSLLIEWIKGE